MIMSPSIISIHVTNVIETKQIMCEKEEEIPSEKFINCCEKILIEKFFTREKFRIARIPFHRKRESTRIDNCHMTNRRLCC